MFDNILLKLKGSSKCNKLPAFLFVMTDFLKCSFLNCSKYGCFKGAVVVSTVTSSQEDPWFSSCLGLFVCVELPCHGTLAFSQSPKIWMGLVNW